MTQKELEQKVIDAEGRVAKREAVLKKHNSQLAKMIEKGADRFDVSIKREDIKSATSKQSLSPSCSHEPNVIYPILPDKNESFSPTSAPTPG